MGTKSSKHYYEPESETSAPSIPHHFEISEQKIFRDKLVNSITEEKLSKPRFVQKLSLLEELGYKILRDTPLALGLFNCFDVDRSGDITREEFVNGCLKMFFIDQNAKIKLTFQAYSKYTDKIYYLDLLEALTKTWMLSFTFLMEKLKENHDFNHFFISNKLKDVSKENLNKFVENARQSLLPHVIHDWKLYKNSNIPLTSSEALKNAYLDYNQFSQWASEDRTISLKYYNHSVHVAFTLLNIEKKVAPDVTSFSYLYAN